MKKKIIALVLCMVLLVAASVTATMAYLTSQDSVTNTFTVGNVSITLDEAKVNEYGKPIDANGTEVALASAPRVESNEYRLVPGGTYTKDPTIRVAANSEACYLFAKVENGISGITGDIAMNSGWALVEGTTNVYAYNTVVQKNSTEQAFTVFNSFSISKDVTDLSSYATKTDSTKTIVVTAYAIQKEGFATAKAAWDANFAPATTN